MFRSAEDTDIHPIALTVWMFILALEDRLPATIAGIAIRKTGNLCVGDFHANHSFAIATRTEEETIWPLNEAIAATPKDSNLYM